MTIVCLDPYEMRHAYEIDTLIAEGYDGRGQTIVIVDAFQNPSLSAQMTTFDNFYGLPAVQLAVVAPDGLTPFDPKDADMAGRRRSAWMWNGRTRLRRGHGSCWFRPRA